MVVYAHSHTHTHSNTHISLHLILIILELNTLGISFQKKKTLKYFILIHWGTAEGSVHYYGILSTSFMIFKILLKFVHKLTYYVLVAMLMWIVTQRF